MKNSIPTLILASNSPRRQELLKSAGFTFQVFTRDFDESFPELLPASEVAEYLSKIKNDNYRKLLGDEIIITADTTVILKNQVLNKPKDRNEAMEMLTKLSDTSHKVVSGTTISSSDKLISFSDETLVELLPVTPDEINFYIEKYQPFDKAGAYGIQEWIGLTKVKNIQGSYFNVMGLPVHKVYQVLSEEFNFHISK